MGEINGADAMEGENGVRESARKSVLVEEEGLEVDESGEVRDGAGK